MPAFDQLLPPMTKGYISFPSVGKMRDRWARTQIGQLVADPVMQPFTQDVRNQIRNQLIDDRFHLSLELDQLMNICSGELCIATILPKDDATGHASVILVNVKDNQAATLEFLAEAAAQLDSKGGKRTVQQINGQEVVVYHVAPGKKERSKSRLSFEFLAGDLLVLGNHEAVCLDVLKRYQAEGRDGIASQTAHQRLIERVSDGASGTPDVQWYIDPFGYAQVIRNARGGPKKRGTDILSILKTQGFNAVEAIGGWIHMSTGNEDFLHRTFIFAPGASDGDERFRLAARMLDFPNSNQWSWPDWVPRNLASAAQLRWNVREAFEYSSTLVDAIAGDEQFFEDLLASIQNDPNGPANQRP